MQIRTAGIDDSLKIANLHTASWRANYREVLPPEYLDAKIFNERVLFWEQELVNLSNKTHILIAEEANNEIVGFICIRLINDVYGSKIDNFHVATGFQAQGLGTKLLECATLLIMEHAPNYGVWLWVNESNLSARRFYQGLFAKEVETVYDKELVLGCNVTSIRCAWRSPVELLEIIAQKKQVISRIFK